MTVMDIMGLVLAWYAIGLATIPFSIALDWYRGTNLTGDNLINYAKLAFLGPGMVFLFVVFLVCDIIDSASRMINRGGFRQRVLIEGRKK